MSIKKEKELKESVLRLTKAEIEFFRLLIEFEKLNKRKN